MMGSFVGPLGLALALAVVVTSFHRRLPPRLAARIAAIALMLVAVAALPTTAIVATAFLAHLPVVGFGFEWCARAVGLHGSVPLWAGVPSVVLLIWGAVRVRRLLSGHRALRRHEAGEVHITTSRTPYAVTLPGRGGQIMISQGLLDVLDDDEQAVVVAHETAHACHRHDRYLLIAELAVAVLPPLRALARRVTYSVERWADDAAATACGDRRLVAATLGKVALHTHAPTVAGFAGLGVASRMGALLQPPVPTPRLTGVALLWFALAATAATALYQLHHLERLLPALCPH